MAKTFSRSPIASYWSVYCWMAFATKSLQILVHFVRRRTTVEFSPAFQGREEFAKIAPVALATIESISAFADATKNEATPVPGLERPG
jgi:hypothetical protein